MKTKIKFTLGAKVKKPFNPSKNRKHSGSHIKAPLPHPSRALKATIIELLPSLPDLPWASRPINSKAQKAHIS